MIMETTKTNIKSLIIISLIIVFSLSATYAFLNLSASANNATTGNGGCFLVNYSGQAINNSALVSTTNYNEGASSQVVLSKASNCEIYTEADIMIYTNTTTTAPISDGALKYKIEIISGDGQIISGGEGSITTTGDTTLATVSLTETATTYVVYIWIDSSISKGAYNGTTYSGYLYANSTQTSTIK